MASLGSCPPYFGRLGELNRRGPARLAAAPTLPELPVQQVQRLIECGAEVVDVRPVAAYAGGHLSGALSIPLRDVFATWLGWLTDGHRPLVVVRDGEQDVAEIIWAAAKIGVDRLLAGQLAGGVGAWADAGHELTRTAVIGPAEVTRDDLVLDVRQEPEFWAEHLPGSRNIELGDLLGGGPELGSGPVVVMCGHGERASSAASLLERAGQPGVRILAGGPTDWAVATGRHLQAGP
ncbi:MAG: hypothetical protein NVSMB13_12040 [Mycobacteriales bacterium]